jgi:hypothetical protein
VVNIFSKEFCFSASLCVIFLSIISCGGNSLLKIGHGGGYLSAVVFAAQEEFPADYMQFKSSADIGYSLLSGKLDAGFIDADKLAAFSRLKGFEKLEAVGKITYPYGATLVLRKGLNVRINELNGLVIAASSPECILLEDFKSDAQRLGADIADVKYEYMAFDAMIPALEARVVDAAIIKGSFAVVALHEGHSILYQNWDMVPGDECCPAIIDQAALVLLARKNRPEALKPFLDALEKANELPADSLRMAVASNTVIPFEILRGQPVPEFSAADNEIIEIFIEAAEEHGDDDDD